MSHCFLLKVNHGMNKLNYWSVHGNMQPIKTENTLSNQAIVFDRRFAHQTKCKYWFT